MSFDILKYMPYKRLGKIGLVLYPIPLIMLAGMFYFIEAVKGISVDIRFAMYGDGITDQLLSVSLPLWLWPVLAFLTFVYGAMYMHLYHKSDSDERLRDLLIYGFALMMVITAIGNIAQSFLLALEMLSIL